MAAAVPIPKIIYPSGGGTTFILTYPPRKVPFRDYGAIVHQNIASSGVKETVYERTDIFFPFEMEWVKAGADASGWDSFVQSALQGVPFDYYPDNTVNSFTTYTLEDQNWTSAFKSLGMYSFKMKFRQRVGWPAAIPSGGAGQTSFIDDLSNAGVASYINKNWLELHPPVQSPFSSIWQEGGFQMAAVLADTFQGLLIQHSGQGSATENIGVGIFPRLLMNNAVYNANQQFMETTVVQLCTAPSNPMDLGYALFYNTEMLNGVGAYGADFYYLSLTFNSVNLDRIYSGGGRATIIANPLGGNPAMDDVVRVSVDASNPAQTAIVVKKNGVVTGTGTDSTSARIKFGIGGGFYVVNSNSATGSSQFRKYSGGIGL